MGKVQSRSSFHGEKHSRTMGSLHRKFQKLISSACDLARQIHRTGDNVFLGLRRDGGIVGEIKNTSISDLRVHLGLRRHFARSTHVNDRGERNSS